VSSSGPGSFDRKNRGSDVREHSSEPRFLTVGEVVRPHGIRGEIKVQILTDFPDRFQLLEEVYIGNEGAEPHPYLLERCRYHQGFAILKLRGCNDRTAAEMLRGQLVQIPVELAMPLGEDEYYAFQLLGLAVQTTSGEYLGSVTEVLDTGANDVYVVQGPKGEVLLPAIDGVIRDIDLETRCITIVLLDGLI
jgi:16S rRNA processing protein RimM